MFYKVLNATLSGASKGNNKNNRLMYYICAKLTIKIQAHGNDVLLVYLFVILCVI